jgi:hypothetical protein
MSRTVRRPTATEMRRNKQRQPDTRSHEAHFLRTFRSITFSIL